MVKARIIVEGKDDKNLIQQLLAHLVENKSISIKQENINYHQYIISMRGKSNLLNHKVYER
jgi:5S rRNA maturation endonuclease (ribonuclease M5)